MDISSKAVSGIVIFGLSFASGTSSFIAVRCVLQKAGLSTRIKRILSILNCFSGGVFLSASILDLLPEAREKMNDALEKLGTDNKYPFTELLLGAGILLLLCFESCVQACLKRRMQRKMVSNSVESPVSCWSRLAICCNEHEKHSSRPNHTKLLLGKNPERKSNENSNVLVEDSAGCGDNEVMDWEEDFELFEINHDDTSALLSEDEETDFIQSKRQSKPGKTLTTDVPNSSAKHSQKDNFTIQWFRGVALFVALSFHMIFDGIALGLLQHDNKVWRLLIALVLHKLLVFFTIGIQITSVLKTPRSAIFAILLFALVTPSGILIGASLTSDEASASRDAVAAVLQGLATGTFLFVTFFEILHRELGSHAHDGMKVVGTILGYGLIACIRLFQEE